MGVAHRALDRKLKRVGQLSFRWRRMLQASCIAISSRPVGPSEKNSERHCSLELRFPPTQAEGNFFRLPMADKKETKKGDNDDTLQNAQHITAPDDRADSPLRGDTAQEHFNWRSLCRI